MSTYDFTRLQQFFMGLNLNAAPDMLPTFTVSPAGIVRDDTVCQEDDLDTKNMCYGITSTPTRYPFLPPAGAYAVVPGLAHRRQCGLRADSRRAGLVRCVCNPHRSAARARASSELFPRARGA